MQLQADASGLRIVDEGRGTAAADLPRVFDRSWRGGARCHSGAGLALTICQVITQAHMVGGCKPAGLGCGAAFMLQMAPA